MDVTCSAAVTQGGPFFAQMWFSAGRGAAAVTQVMIFEIRGDVANGTLVRANFNLPVFLPGVGRNWDRTIDEFTWIAQSGRTTAQGGSNLTDFACCTPADQVVDCCSETLAKLDQVISYVSRVWPTVPA